MKHQLTIQVNGLSFPAYADISYTNKGRTLESVTCPDPGPDVLAMVEQTAIDLDDVLFIVAEYLTLTGKTSVGTSVGSLAIDCTVVDPERFQDDVNGRTYMVKLIDVHSNLHLFDVGACNGLTAMHYASQAISIPVRSSVTQPVMEV